MLFILSPLLLLPSAATAAPPSILIGDAGCDWDAWSSQHYWWFEAWVYDPDHDVMSANVLVYDDQGTILAWGEMWPAWVGGAYSDWYYDFYQFHGGPECPGRYGVTIAVYDYYWGSDWVEFVTR